ncbi:hypothetical protein FPOAC1_008508 [Fusarium poae]|uniref:hypothetical protein n=1 Tax=Fusarium poae TaxID=36050 RepID=UPI001CEAE71E|nr:hypothetical protein FPOAC1_008508 [Fusarium poae]KAG8669120.1 hypothetical protein FPOAC1_008508 [Fusarium poae]
MSHGSNTSPSRVTLVYHNSQTRLPHKHADQLDQEASSLAYQPASPYIEEQDGQEQNRSPRMTREQPYRTAPHRRRRRHRIVKVKGKGLRGRAWAEN